MNILAFIGVEILIFAVVRWSFQDLLNYWKEDNERIKVREFAKQLRLKEHQYLGD